MGKSGVRRGAKGRVGEGEVGRTGGREVPPSQWERQGGRRKGRKCRVREREAEWETIGGRGRVGGREAGER